MPLRLLRLGGSRPRASFDTRRAETRQVWQRGIAKRDSNVEAPGDDLRPPALVRPENAPGRASKPLLPATQSASARGIAGRPRSQRPLLRGHLRLVILTSQGLRGGFHMSASFSENGFAESSALRAAFFSRSSYSLIGPFVGTFLLVRFHDLVTD